MDQMRKSDIDAELDRLEQRLQSLLGDQDHARVLARFAEETAPLNADPPAEHAAYISRRIDCMLAAAGLVPGEPEGEPCPQGPR